MRHLTINGLTTEAARGGSIFDCAGRLGVRVPTSCQKQGKCQECLVEVVGGWSSFRRARPKSGI